MRDLVYKFLCAWGMLFLCDCVFPGAPPARQNAFRVQRLVTGDTAGLAEVVAANATLKFYFTPVPPLPGTDPSLPYPAGYNITDQVLTVSQGGFTSAWNVQMSSWDVNGDGSPLLRSFQGKLSSGGYFGANTEPPNPGCDLEYPAHLFPCLKQCLGGPNNGLTCTTVTDCGGSACTFKHCSGGANNGALCVASSQCAGQPCADPCPARMGEKGASCGSAAAGFCDWGWQNVFRPDWVMAANGSSDQFPAADITSPTGAKFAGTTTAGTELFDAGERFYIGTLVLPVPSCARGTYNLGFNTNETFAQDEAQPANNIAVAALVSGQLVIPFGSCCTNLGSNGICTDTLTASQCDQLAGGSPHVWREGIACDVACPACAQEPCPTGIVSTDPPICTIDARYPNDPNNAGSRFGFQSLTMTLSSDPGPLTAANFQMSVVPAGAGVPVITNVNKSGLQVTLTFQNPIPSMKWSCAKLLLGDTDVACISALGADTDASRTSEAADTLALIDALDSNPSPAVWQTDLDRSGTFTPLDILASIDLLNGAGAFNLFKGATIPPCPTVGIP